MKEFKVFWVCLIVVAVVPLAFSDTMTFTYSGTGGDMNAYLEETNPTVAYGQERDIWVRTDANKKRVRTILRFDVSALTGKYSSIDSAVLRLWNAGEVPSSNFDLSICQVLAVNADWQIGSASWANKDQSTSTSWAGAAGLTIGCTDYYTPVVGSIPIRVTNPPEYGWRETNILPSVIDDWALDSSINGGFLLFGGETGANNCVRIYGPIYDVNPQLIVTYTAASPPATCMDVWVRGLGNALDVNSDCRIDFKDFAELAQLWSLCYDPNVNNCP